MDINRVVEIAERELNGYKWEVFVQRVKKLKAESQNLYVETFTVSEEYGYSIRVLRGKSQGFAYSTSISEEDIKDTVLKAKELADITSEDEANGILEKFIPTDKIEYYDTNAVNLHPSEKADISLEIERKTKAYDPRIKKVRNAMFVENVFQTGLYNSEGVNIEQKGTVYTAMVAAVAEEGGESQISWGYTASRFLEDLDVDGLIEETAKTAVSLLGGKTLKTSKIHVVFSPYVASEFLATFSSVFSGESLIKGKTFLEGRENTKVFSEKINIVDDGRLKKGVGTHSYDDEGFPTQRTVIVENGIFKGFLHNLYTARKTGCRSTGNAVRKGIKSLPSVDITNLFIERGSDRVREIMKDLDSVFYVTDVMGLHTADPVSGSFSIGASGIFYSRGEEVFGVRGVTIADNLSDLFNKVVAVDSDLKFYGNVGSPSILFEDVMVAGE